MKPHRLVISVLVLLFSVLTASCQAQAPRSTKTSSAVSRGSTAGKALRFSTYRYVDRQGIGTEAFTILVPAGWQFQGGIQWVLDNPGMPARASLRIRNPASSEEFEILPAMGFSWNTSMMFRSTMPVGSSYFGNEVRPPMDAVTALRNIVVPRMRGNLPGLKVVMEQNVPQAASPLDGQAPPQPGAQMLTSAAKLRLEYQQDGKWMEEDLGGVVVNYSFQVPTMQGPATHYIWVLDYLMSAKAEKGKLDGDSTLFETIAYSFQLNPQWFSRYTQVVNMLTQQQIQRINSIGELSRYISRTNDEISDMITDSYNQRQAVQDRIADNFSQAIRGVDAYVTPDNRSVELPSGYRHAWTNALGEYVISDDANYNPNVGSNQTWTPLKKRQ